MTKTILSRVVAERLAAARIVDGGESFAGRTPRIAEMFVDGE